MFHPGQLLRDFLEPVHHIGQLRGQRGDLGVLPGDDRALLSQPVSLIPREFDQLVT